MADNRLKANCETMDSVAMDGTKKTVLTLTKPSRQIVIFNDCTDMATITFDNGVTSGTMPLASGATFVQDIASNRVADADFCWPTGTIISAQTGGATGTVYATSFYVS